MHDFCGWPSGEDLESVRQNCQGKDPSLNRPVNFHGGIPIQGRKAQGIQGKSQRSRHSTPKRRLRGRRTPRKSLNEAPNLEGIPLRGEGGRGEGEIDESQKVKVNETGHGRWFLH